MHKRVLIALDLEGVNNVAGEPYSGLRIGSEEWEKARRQAAFEINEAADALFAAGARRVAVWDNHGGGPNLDPADIDTRVELLTIDKTLPRMYFAGEFDCVCFFGYHAMEGTLGGVLAHTMNSTTVQYYKLNGKYIGEVDMDSYIAASHGIPSCFFAGGDIACRQAERAVPGIVTVVTKTELSRNEAIFRDNKELAEEIRERIVKAVELEDLKPKLSLPATFEKSFKRTEDAAWWLDRLLSFGIAATHPSDEILGKDAHTVVSKIYTIDDFIKCI
jgi:D-amino peptidase